MNTVVRKLSENKKHLRVDYTLQIVQTLDFQIVTSIFHMIFKFFNRDTPKKGILHTLS